MKKKQTLMANGDWGLFTFCDIRLYSEYTVRRSSPGRLKSTNLIFKFISIAGERVGVAWQGGGDNSVSANQEYSLSNHIIQVPTHLTLD